MNTAYTSIIIVTAVIIALFALMISSRSKDKKKEQDLRIRKSWGTVRPRLFSNEEIAYIRAWSDSLAIPSVDDITANDTDLDRVFGSLPKPFSSAGEEVLYAWIRHPETDDRNLKERDRLAEGFAADEGLRMRTLRIFDDIGYLKHAGFYESIRGLHNAEPIGRFKYILLGAATFCSIVLLFIVPLPAVIALFILIIADFRVHLSMKKKTEPYIHGFQALLRLLSASDAIVSLDAEPLRLYASELKTLSPAFSAFRKGSFWVTSGSRAGTGFDDALIEYLKMFFHTDLIQFDRMLTAVRDHGSEAERIFEIIGTLDAAAAVASLRASGKKWCRPELVPYPTTDERGSADSGTAKVRTGDHVRLEITDLVHPLLENAVPNSVDTDSEILLTGSNASGKSTFLKSTALCAILAQSIYTVPATFYRAPCFRIYTSMALSDSLSRGESYFVVELKSLKRICDAVKEEHTPVLAIVDEVLRGTNTVERIAASSEILKDLDRPNAVIFAATHDLELTYMLEGHFRNMHFGEEIRDGDVLFDYTLREGRAESTNAIELLGVSGYDPDTVRRARETADRFRKNGIWSLSS